MNKVELRKLAKKADEALEILATAQKWGAQKHIDAAQKKVDDALAEYDKAEASMKIEE